MHSYISIFVLNLQKETFLCQNNIFLLGVAVSVCPSILFFSPVSTTCGWIGMKLLADICGPVVINDHNSAALTHHLTPPAVPFSHPNTCKTTDIPISLNCTLIVLNKNKSMAVKWSSCYLLNEL